MKKYEYSWAPSNGIKAMKYQSHFNSSFWNIYKIVDWYTSQLVSILPHMLIHHWNNRMKLHVLVSVLAYFELHRAESSSGKLIMKDWSCQVHPIFIIPKVLIHLFFVWFWKHVKIILTVQMSIFQNALVYITWMELD